MHRSPLHDVHVRLGAKLVPFGGWEMPLQYAGGTIAEHISCRESCAIFDVSHLGTVRVEGSDAFERLQRAFTNDLHKIGPGRSQYTHLLDEDGSVLDDIIVWWLPDDGTGVDRFDVVPNASNTSRVIGVIGGVDTTSRRAVIAVQGPNSHDVATRVLSTTVRRNEVVHVVWNGVECTVAGTGYTGEDGLEIAVPASHAGGLWNALVEAGGAPAGLGARDTLRLEAGLPLHGHELGPGITPLQAGLQWVVAWSKGEFVGRSALERERDAGITRRLVGISVEGRRPAREGAVVSSEGRPIGTVTSGNYSPTLGHAIALAFVDSSVSDGTAVEIDVRGTSIAGVVTSPRFLNRRPTG
ncbi:MAG: aminomethyltransferase [Actinomycetota bacterium]|jgi:aminomethyltransferase